MPRAIGRRGLLISLQTAVVVAYSRNLALECRFRLALGDRFSYSQRGFGESTKSLDEVLGVDNDAVGVW